jgi:phosphoribosylanthranilate isomerase
VAERRKTSCIKVCGITRVADAIDAVELGVDAIGLVFYASSPRAISVPRARDIVRALGPFVTTVGLFVNADKHDIEEILQQVPLHILQFHGDEAASFCRQFHRPWIKALRMKPGIDIHDAVLQYAEADAVLLDSYKDGVPGGTGEKFVWSALPENIQMPIIVAGGLNPGNVATAIDIMRPYAVDVSGGVESEPGKKDRQKIQAFVQAVKSAH